MVYCSCEAWIGLYEQAWVGPLAGPFLGQRSVVVVVVVHQALGWMMHSSVRFMPDDVLCSPNFVMHPPPNLHAMHAG